MNYANYLLLGLLALAGLWTVLTPTLIKSAIGLALTSALLTVLMFQMEAPLAGVFELSVCAGLITVIFVSAISLTRPNGDADELKRKDARSKAFLPLLGVAAWVGVMLWVTGYALDVKIPPMAHPGGDVRSVLWDARRLELVGQILILFVGVFGVVILFKEKKAQKETAP
jgi:NADH-quinone oxidoreductase subunit J